MSRGDEAMQAASLMALDAGSTSGRKVQFEKRQWDLFREGSCDWKRGLWRQKKRERVSGMRPSERKWRTIYQGSERGAETLSFSCTASSRAGSFTSEKCYYHRCRRKLKKYTTGLISRVF